MKSRVDQSGITLVVSLIMLVVLTLLVVSGIKFGNINLKISGNAQVEAESSAAAMVALEKMLILVNDADKVDLVAAQPAMVVSTGGTSFTVNAKKPVCLLSKAVDNSTLDYAKLKDRSCIEQLNLSGGMFRDDGSGGLGQGIKGPSACKDQQWDIEATVDDAATGAKVTMLQGAALRVGSEVDCP